MLWGSALVLMTESSSSTAVPLTLREDEWDASRAKSIQPWEAIKSERELQPDLDSPRHQRPGFNSQEVSSNNKHPKGRHSDEPHFPIIVAVCLSRRILFHLISFKLLLFFFFLFFFEKLESVRTMKKKTSELMVNVMVPDNVLYVLQCGKIPCEHSAEWELGCTCMTLSPFAWSFYIFPHHWLVNNLRYRID